MEDEMFDEGYKMNVDEEVEDMKERKEEIEMKMKRKGRGVKVRGRS